MHLHFAKFLSSARACCPFRLSVFGEITPPILRRLRVLVVSLEQQREVEHRVGISRGGVQRTAQTIDGGF